MAHKKRRHTAGRARSKRRASKVFYNGGTKTF